MTVVINTKRLLIALVLLACSCAVWSVEQADVYSFTVADIAYLQQFSIDNLPPLPKAPDNRVADNKRAARLGLAIFSDTRFSATGELSCVSCHQPQLFFTDGLARAQGVARTRRNAPTLLGAAYGPWKNWDGSKDSLWSQALGPLENEKEQAISRLDVAKLIVRFYLSDYEAVFGKLDNPQPLLALTSPASTIGSDQAVANWQQLTDHNRQRINRIFSNVGKAIMAYQRQIPLPASRFDQFLRQLARQPDNKQELARIMSSSEVRGMRLFVGAARCASCHNGPLLSNFEFHNVGAKESDTSDVDLGRYLGIERLRADEFTCLSSWSDASASQCEEMKFLKKNGPELVGAFKTPSLRNVAKTAPYMQSGQLATLEEVVAHYNQPTPPFYDRKQHPSRPHFDIVPLNLSQQQQQDLVAFLQSLTSEMPADSPWWQ